MKSVILQFKIQWKVTGKILTSMIVKYLTKLIKFGNLASAICLR